MNTMKITGEPSLNPVERSEADVLVCGGGPAGIAAAWGAGQGRRRG